jgi:hypothetical protein
MSASAMEQSSRPDGSAGAAVCDLERLVDSIRWTFDTYLLPTLTDPLAQSYGRTVSVLLAQAQARLREEPRALAEELRDLRATVTAIAPAFPDELRETTRHALAQTSEPPPVVSLSQLQADIGRLDALVAAAVPALDSGTRQLIEALLIRRLERRRRWMPDNAPPNAF